MTTKINYTQIQAEADLYKYSIVPSISSGNLTVALKNYLGQDPSITTPVKVQIGDTVRTITSALSIITATSGSSRMNAGSSELATKEIDYFVYLGWQTSTNSIRMYISRYSAGNTINDFSNNYLNEKYLHDYLSDGTSNSTDRLVNIGRFSAILSSGAGYTWSTPSAGFQVINYYINESKWLDYIPVLSGGATMTTLSYAKYKIVGNLIFLKNSFIMSTTGGVEITQTTPFSLQNTAQGLIRCNNNTTLVNCSGEWNGNSIYTTVVGTNFSTTNVNNRISIFGGI